MILKEVLKKAIDILRSSNNESPAFEAGVLLCHFLKCDKVFIYSHGETKIESNIEKAFIGAVEKRSAGTPLQHITGHQEFMSLDFIVSPDVLIPRQDTEILVETVINFIRCRKACEKVNILDIGTGSGCIAISLAHYIPCSQVTAVDISPAALNIAKKNAEILGTAKNMEFIQGSIFSENLLMDKYDVIVSNPPYIPARDIDGLKHEVKGHEPILALDGGNDGLDFYRRISDIAAEALNTGGLIAFEVGLGQADDVAGIMRRKYNNIEIYRDLSEIQRVVTGNIL